MKICTRCGEQKPLSEFAKADEKYHRGHCKPCEVKRVAEWRENNRERWRVNARNSYHSRKASDPTFPLRHLLAGVKARAGAKGVPFDLAAENLPPIPAVCPVLGIPLSREGGRTHPNLPELDRLIPKLGYVRSNVQWISRRANTIKNNATYEELERVTAWVGEQLRKAHPL